MSLPEDGTTSLNEAASMEDELRNMTMKLIKLSHNQDHLIMEEAGACFRLEYNYPKLAFCNKPGTVCNNREFQITVYVER